MSDGFSIAISVYLIAVGAAGYERYKRDGMHFRASIDAGLGFAGCLWLGFTLDRALA